MAIPSIVLRLPRLDTFASSSKERSQFRRRTAPRGQGARGCGERIRLWPRIRIWEGNFVRQWDRCEKVDQIFMVQFFWWILFSVIEYEMPGVTKQKRSV